MIDKRSFCRLVAAAIALGQGGAAAFAQTAPATAQAEDVAARLRTFFAQPAQRDFSGAVIVARNGAMLFEGAYGLANIATGERNTPDTRFNLASAGKLLTQIAVLQLAQRGRIDLDAPVGRYLPDYPNPAVRDRVTLRQLYNMRSGVGSYWNERYAARRASLRTIDDYLNLFATDPLAFEPGTQSLYSNGGYIILGKVIETVSGLSYDEYVRRHIIEPARMTGTGHFTLDELGAGTAVGYMGAAGPVHGPPVASAAEASQTPTPQGPALPPDAAALRPNTEELPGRGLSAGGGYSTVRDFLRLDQAIRAHRLLDPSFTGRLLGEAVARGEGFSGIAGGFPGVNTAFLMFGNGLTIIVFTNRDPPLATDVGQAIAEMLGQRLPPMGPS